MTENPDREDKRKTNLRKQPTKKRKKTKPRYGSELSLLSQFKYIAIMTIVASIFIFLGIWLTRDNNEVANSNNNTSNNPSTSGENNPNNSSDRNNTNPDASLLPPPPTNAPISNTPPPEILEREKQGEPVYRLVKAIDLSESSNLQKIVDSVVDLTRKNKLNTQVLSVTLIDVNTGEIAGYQQQTPRFPASVVKMFWLVELYGQIAVGRATYDDNLKQQIVKMIKDSDNEAASYIIDLMTDTKSLPTSEAQAKSYDEWLNSRKWLSRFFANSNLGYEGINISQKTFPIPKENLPEPLGYDLKIRGNDLNKPIRNKISTKQAAQLMYEIATGNTIDSNYSRTLFDWLKWDLVTEERKKIDPNTGSFNPIVTFFGEALEKENVTFASKAGWTSQTRQEVAYVATPDGKTKYILAVFAEDKAYAKSQKIFPQISKLVYQKMVAR